jgi:VWFA-related protein
LSRHVLARREKAVDIAMGVWKADGMRCSLCLFLASLVVWVQTPSQPTFRASSILVRADVIVTDKSGRRIDGLTAADFIVKERGVLQEVREFEHVVVPPGNRSYSLDNPPPERPREFTNAIPPAQGRAFVFMIASISAAHIVETKRVLTEFLNSLSPDDLVAVSYLARSDVGVDFTSDPALIARSFSRLTEGIAGVPGRQVDWFKNVLLTLDSSRHTRRAIVYISESPPFGRADPKDFGYRVMLEELGRAAQLNISIYSIDPRGLMAPLLGLDGHLEAQSPERNKAMNQALFNSKQAMKTLAESTNGLAFTDSWDIRRAARTLLTDNNDYYVLGIHPEPYKPDGKFHDLDIRVRIPGARVRARQGYVAEPLSKPVGSLSGDDALSQGLPGGDLRLVGDALVEPVPAPGAAPAAVPGNVRLVLRVQYPDPALLAQHGDQLAIRWIAIDSDAEIRASGEETIQVPAAQPAPPGVVPIELRLQLPRGHSTIRVLVSSKVTGTRGWLHIPLDVPSRNR